MDIRVPRLGEGADSGSVVNIYVREGARIKKDQTILDLENEKALAAIPSPASGLVTKIHVKVGDKVTVGQLLVSLAEEGVPAVIPAEAGIQPDPRLRGDDGVETRSPPASPSVRKMARELGIDLTKIKGSEDGGRIVMGDLRAYIQGVGATRRVAPTEPGGVAPTKPPAEPIDFSKWGKISKKPISSLRQKIAERMSDAWTTIPHVTQFDEADITLLMALRKKNVGAYEKKGARLTLTSFILKAVLGALKKYPSFNSSLEESSQELVLKEYYHLGVAVDTEQGLIVPVLRDVDKKSLLVISKELEELAEKTRQRKVSLDELKGGTFTISNLGSIGGTHFTPIINKPEVAILGVGRAVLKEARLMLPLAVSYDHRVIDGADGARFIREIVEALENFKEEDVSLRGVRQRSVADDEAIL